MEKLNPPQGDPHQEPLHHRHNPLYQDANRSMHEYLHPTRSPTPSCIMFSPNMPHQEFKSGMIQLLLAFHGLENRTLMSTLEKLKRW